MTTNQRTTTPDELTDWLRAAAEVEHVRGGQLAVLTVLAVMVVVASYLV